MDGFQKFQRYWVKELLLYNRMEAFFENFLQKWRNVSSSLHSIGSKSLIGWNVQSVMCTGALKKSNFHLEIIIQAPLHNCTLGIHFETSIRVSVAISLFVLNCTIDDVIKFLRFVLISGMPRHRYCLGISNCTENVLSTIVGPGKSFSFYLSEIYFRNYCSLLAPRKLLQMFFIVSPVFWLAKSNHLRSWIEHGFLDILFAPYL